MLSYSLEISDGRDFILFNTPTYDWLKIDPCPCICIPLPQRASVLLLHFEHYDEYGCFKQEKTYFIIVSRSVVLPLKSFLLFEITDMRWTDMCFLLHIGFAMRPFSPVLLSFQYCVRNIIHYRIFIISRHWVCKYILNLVSCQRRNRFFVHSQYHSGQ